MKICTMIHFYTNFLHRAFFDSEPFFLVTQLRYDVEYS